MSVSIREPNAEELALRSEFIDEFNRNFARKDFIFEEVAHTYHLAGNPLTSATTFIKRFYEQFDAENKSISYAAKHGLDVEEVRKNWKEAGDVAKVLGSKVHKFIEDFWNGQLIKPEDPDVRFRAKEYLRFHQKNMMDKVQVLQECRVFHEKWGVCGTIDSIFLVQNMLGEYEFQIWDWKTNKDEKFTTDESFAWNMMYHPFSNLKKNSVNEYSLQLSLYKLILQEYGMKIGRCFLCHIPPSGNVKVHEAKDLTKQLRQYFVNSEVRTADSLFE